MSNHRPASITSIPEFLAHALELEYESAERYRELAGNLAVHNNPEIAELFYYLSRMSDRHAQEVEDHAKGVQLPQIPPWDFKWAAGGSPEANAAEQDEDLNYLMTPIQALRLALYNEIRGRDFYAKVAAGSPDAEVRQLAAEMVEEENEHAALLVERLAKMDPTRAERVEDLDPPNMPE
ncbi:MAG: ferritin family protein [Chromatiaceae bacterium]